MEEGVMGGRYSRKVDDIGYDPNPVRREFEALARYKAKCVQSTINLEDAEYECVHGRLPHDAHRDPKCGCWVNGNSDRAVALEHRQQEVSGW